MENQQQKRAKVIGTDWCPYCTQARNIFEQAKVEYEWVDSEQHPEERAKYKSQLKWNTVPMIWVDGEFIGGASDLKTAINKNKVKL